MGEQPKASEQKTFGNCSKCSAPLPPGGGVCEYCGVASRPPTTWEPGGKLHEMVEFGLNLDAQLDAQDAMVEQQAAIESGPTCSGCGEGNRSGANFCRHCGRSLS